MEKRKLQKYVITGSDSYRFATLGLKIGKRKNRNIRKNENGKYQVSIGNHIYLGELVLKKQNKYTIEVNGNQYEFIIEQDSTFKRKATQASENCQNKIFSIKSPMPGKICEVFISKGSSVKKGEPLLILEAMKMQNQVLAPIDAKASSVYVKNGDTVFSGQILIELEQQ